MGKSLDDISVDTVGVSNAAKEIGRINNTIQNEFSIIEVAMNNLSKNWNGYGKDNVFSQYKTFKKNYQDDSRRNRYSTIKNHTQFLDEIVAKGYVETEKTNVDLVKNYSDSIADQYK